MIPYHTYNVIELGFINIRTHAFLMFLGLLVFAIFFVVSAGKKKKKIIHALMLSLLVVVGVWVGSKMFHVLFHLDKYDISEIFDLSRGFVSFGGITLAVFFCFLYIRFYRLKFFEWGDIMATYFPLISIFTRVGCFLNGCCYGIPTNLPWGIRHIGEVRHPTQLYHIVAMLIMLVILSRLKIKKRFAGFLLFSYFIMYFTQRFIIDFFRHYKPEYFIFSLTKFQWISLIVIGVCTFLFIKKSGCKLRP